MRTSTAAARAGSRTPPSNPLLADLDAQRHRQRQQRPHAVPEPPEPEQASPAEQRSPAHGVVCTVGLCPICTLVTAFGDARPELTEHLLLAGRELLLAMKVLIDARLQGEEPQPAPGGLERISIE